MPLSASLEYSKTAALVYSINFLLHHEVLPQNCLKHSNSKGMSQPHYPRIAIHVFMRMTLNANTQVLAAPL